MGVENVGLDQGLRILKEVIFKMRCERRVGKSLGKKYKKKRRERGFEQKGKEISKLRVLQFGEENEISLQFLEYRF